MNQVHIAIGIMIVALVSVLFMVWMLSRADRIERERVDMLRSARLRQAELDRAYQLNRNSQWRDGGKTWTA